MSSSPIVSVIMPVHNRFPLVDEAVQSVFDQTHRPIQLIIVDDCSDEPYIPKITSQPGFEVILIRHDTNQGPGASRETGRQAATGDYIAYLDSDDLCHPEKLEKQVALLQANPEAGMCYCTSVEFTQLPITGNEKIRNRSDQTYHQFLPTILSRRPWGTSACLWTKHASDAIGPWFPGWAWEDYAYDFKAGCQGIRIIHLPKCLCYYRVEHGETRLSESARKYQVINRANSVLEMNREMIKYKSVIEKDTENQLVRILYYQAMHLFYLDEKKRALKLLSEIRKTTFNKITIYSLLFFVASPFVKSRSLGHLLYHFRNHF